MSNEHVSDTSAPVIVTPRMPADIKPGYLIEVNGNWEPVQNVITETKWCRVQVLDHWFPLDAMLPIPVKTRGITDAEMKVLASKRRAPIGNMRQ